MQQLVRRRVLTPRVALVLAAGGVAAVSVPLALPAHAAPGAVAVSNWYFDDPGMSASAAAQMATPSGVPMGDLGIGYQNGGSSPVAVPVTVPKSEPDKITGLALRPGFDRAGQQDHQLYVLDAGRHGRRSGEHGPGRRQPPAVVACLSNRVILAGSGTGPSPYQAVPSYDCGTKDLGAYDAATTSYKFSAVNIAQAWADDGDNNGLVILPDPAVTQPTTYTLSFLPASKIKGSISGTPAVSSPAPEVAAPQDTSASAPATSSQAAPITTRSSSPRSAAPVAVVAGPAGAAPVAAAPAPVSAAEPAPAEVAAPAAVPAGGPVAPAVAPAPAADDAAPAGDAGVAPAAAPTSVAPMRRAAATKRVTVSSGIGPVGYVVLVLILVAVLAATSLGLAKPAEATGAQVSRLSRMLNS